MRLHRASPGPHSPKPRILVVAGFAPSLINFRGPLLQALVHAGLDVVCTAPEDDEKVADALSKMGVRYVPIALQRNRMGVLADLRYWLALYGLFRRERPDMVLAYTVKPVVFGLSAARVAGVRSRHALITGLGYAFTSGGGGRRAFRGLVQRLYRGALSGARNVFFQNPDDRELFVREGIVRPAQTEVVNGSGVDLGHFAAVPLRKGGAVSFLLVARLLADKGIREYVAAARVVKKRDAGVRFLLVGPADPNPAAIPLNEVQSWHSEGVIEYLGEMSDVRPAIRECSVYVLPSYREGVPRTVLEAMAMGRPIITTDAPGCRETVVNGENGFLVPVRSVDALVHAMERFIREPELITRMGGRSREIAEEKFDVRKVNAAMLEAMGL